jgi:hypothetical protein
MRDKDVVERSNVKQPSFGGGSRKLVFTSRLNLREYNKMKNKTKTFISQL